MVSAGPFFSSILPGVELELTFLAKDSLTNLGNISDRIRNLLDQTWCAGGPLLCSSPPMPPRLSASTSHTSESAAGGAWPLEAAVPNDADLSSGLTSTKNSSKGSLSSPS